MNQAAASIALLIRHAHTDALGHRLCGRAAGVALSSTGEAQARRLAAALASYQIAAIYTSPLERAVATARAIAAHQPAAAVSLCEDLSEMDFGAWTGKSFTDLDSDPAWRAFNSHRSTAPVPGGERAIDVQRRVVAALARLTSLHAGQTIGIVSHGDLVRSAVLHYAGTPLDLYDRFEIDPASVTAVAFWPSGPRLLYVNNGSFAEAR
jgi:probable phosphoglycerate mutase